MAKYYGVRGSLTAKPGKRQGLLDILGEAARGMEEVPGCLCYILGTSQEEPEAVHVYEVWLDKAAHQASLSMPVFQQLIERAKPIIESMTSQPDLIIHGGKAAPLG